jgi:hypothetical protein
MKRQYLRVLMALIGFAVSGISAKAQAVDLVEVTIPFQFVVDGKTLPAGTYRVNRISDERWEGLHLSSLENRVSVIVHPSDVESARADTSKLTFETAGNQHFLSQVKTGDNVFNIQVPRQTALLASAPSPSGTASGSN